MENNVRPNLYNAQQKVHEGRLTEFLVMAATFALSFTASANIDDGLLWVFKAKEGVANGSTSSSDFRDQLTVSAATTKTFTFNHPDGYPIYFTNMTVKSGVANATYENQPCLFLPQTTNWVDGVVYSYEQNVGIPKAMLSKSTEGASFYARLKWLGRSRPSAQTYPYNYSFSIFDNGCNWANSGWGVRFSEYNGLSGDAWLGAYVASSSLSCSSGNLVEDESEWDKRKVLGKACAISKSQDWVDVGVTFRCNHEEGKTYVTFFKCHCDSGRISIGRTWTDKLLAAPALNGSLFGTTSAGEHVGGTISGNFRGAVSEIRLWDRCLSEDEMRTVFAGQPQGWTVGADNGSADEFSDTECVSEFNPRTMQWSKMRKTLTAANPSVSLTATFPADRRYLPRTLHIKPIISNDAVGAQLDVQLNGTTIGTVKLRDGDNFFFVEKREVGRLVGSDGVATFTLTRTGNTAGTVMFDFLELTGSFQIGNIDNTSDAQAYSGFTWMGWDSSLKEIYSSAEDTTIQPANLPPETTLNLYFPIKQVVADHYCFRLSTRLFWQSEERVPLSFALNDVAITPTEEVTPKRTFHFDIAPGVLRENNKFSIISGVATETTNDYGIDYYRLDAINTDKLPFVIVVR